MVIENGSLLANPTFEKQTYLRNIILKYNLEKR